MIKSMTGYGRCEKEYDERKITIEMSSVNHRYCDINIRLSKTFMQFEEPIRKLIKKHIQRGKIDVSIYVMSMGKEEVDVVVNDTICSAYLEALNEIGEKYHLPSTHGTADLLRLQELFTLQKKSVDLEVLWQQLRECLEVALEDLLKMREREGALLREDLLGKANGICQVMKRIEVLSEDVVQNYRSKLEEKLSTLLKQVPIDEGRLATELVLFADKVGIDEEVTRFYSHLNQFNEILNESGSVGRKLDFLMQEMNREANTIASKTTQVMVTNETVGLKTEIEKLREQIQNIE